MKKVIVLLAACAFTVSPLGFAGCSPAVPEDPNANANQDKEKEFAPAPGKPDDELKGTDNPGGKFGTPDKKD